MPANRQRPGKLPKGHQAEYPYHAPISEPKLSTYRTQFTFSAATMSNPACNGSHLNRDIVHEEPTAQTTQNLDPEILRSSEHTLHKQILTTILLNDHKALSEFLNHHAELESAMPGLEKCPHWSALLTAAAIANDPLSVHAFLTRVPDTSTFRPIDRWATLLVALEYSDDKIAGDLLAHMDPKPFENTLYGPALLARAVMAGNIKIAEVLIDIAGVGVNVPTGGAVPLHRAAYSGDEGMVKMLQSRGAVFTTPGLQFSNAAEAARAGDKNFLADELEEEEREAREISRRARAIQRSGDET